MQKKVIGIIVLALLTSCGRSDEFSKYEGTWERVRKKSLADSQMVQIKNMGTYLAVKHFRPEDTIGIRDSGYFAEDGLLMLKGGSNILYLPDSKHIVVHNIEYKLRSNNH